MSLERDLKDLEHDERKAASGTLDAAHELWLIRKDFHEITKELVRFLQGFGKTAATNFKIIQLGVPLTMTNNSIVAGTIGTFSAVTVPSGGALQAGAIPVWTVDDPNVSLNADPTGLNVSVATSATDTAASFNLLISGISSNGTAISQSTNVTLTPAVGGGVPATGFAVTQVS